MTPEVRKARKMYVGPRTTGTAIGPRGGPSPSTGAIRKGSMGSRLMARDEAVDPLMALVRALSYFLIK